MEGLKKIEYLGLEWCIGYGEDESKEGLFVIVICKEGKEFCVLNGKREDYYNGSNICLVEGVDMFGRQVVMCDNNNGFSIWVVFGCQICRKSSIS